MSDADQQLSIRRHGHVAIATITRPPHNFLSHETLAALADALEELQDDGNTRAAVIASEGRAFCAGADFSGGMGDEDRFSDRTEVFYTHAIRLFRVRLPLVAAVHGAAVGAGMGLALAADLRVASHRAYFAASFTRLGIHPGFGMTHTVPALLGPARAADLLLTGRRVSGEEALRLGLADRLVADDEVLDEAVRLAGEVAAAAPLAVRATRGTLRYQLADRVAAALEHERAEQRWLSQTNDAREGIAASAERRTPNFLGN
jgi:2-(1,2-epoxy-1,2-dihydrophenyl)acetyl-CoA isomerase